MDKKCYDNSEIIWKILLLNIILLFLFAFNSIEILGVAQTGCCTSGIVPFTCLGVVDESDCCPLESESPELYDKDINPNGPDSLSDCKANFFAKNKACSLVEGCRLGCCCASDKNLKIPQALCSKPGSEFFPGEDLFCSDVCDITQCNNGIDDDGDICVDALDPGCLNPDDNSENTLVGNCVLEESSCADTNYIPKLSNLDIFPWKGGQILRLKWDDECIADFYEISRCINDDCKFLGITKDRQFTDDSKNLLFDVTYTYKIRTIYKLQSPTITQSTATLGNLECLGKVNSNGFCLHESSYFEYSDYLTGNLDFSIENFVEEVQEKFGENGLNRLNKAYLCNDFNVLEIIGPDPECTDSEVCVIRNNVPVCLEKSACNYIQANPFGLYYDEESCLTDKSNGEKKFCFYDKSTTIVNSCYSCNSIMSCYDYKRKDSCTKDNCGIGNCIWKENNDITNQDLVDGVCVSTIATNCQWCDKAGTEGMENIQSFNSVFSSCSEEKSDLLSVEGHQCLYQDTQSKDCLDVVCNDYDKSQCGKAPILKDGNIIDLGNDICNIGVCQWFNTVCRKNADGNNEADCPLNSCDEKDFIKPDAMLNIFRNKKGFVERLLIDIKDKSGIRSGLETKAISQGYKLFFCLDNQNCGLKHPFQFFTKNDNLIISNLGLFDKTKLVFNLDVGENKIKYYAQDPSKNVGLVKEITFEAFDDVNGPIVADFILNENQNTRKDVNGVYYVKNINNIRVIFVEPNAIIEQSSDNVRLRKGSVIIPPKKVNPVGKGQNFEILFEGIDEGSYIFELDVVNDKGISMSEIFTKKIVVDRTVPNLKIVLGGRELAGQPEKFNKSDLQLKLNFSEKVNLTGVVEERENLKINLSSTDNSFYSGNIKFSDGKKSLLINAEDLAGNILEKRAEFSVNANPSPDIKLIQPKFGISQQPSFDFVIETDDEANCRFSKDSRLPFGNMNPFSSNDRIRHSFPISLQVNEGIKVPFFVTCKDLFTNTDGNKDLELSFDTSKPSIITFFVEPALARIPSTTNLRVHTDDLTRCRYSIGNEVPNLNSMILFDNYNNNSFKSVNEQRVSVDSIGTFRFNVACDNMAGLFSEIKSANFEVNPNANLTISVDTMNSVFTNTSVDLLVETNLETQCRFSSDSDNIKNKLFSPEPKNVHKFQLTALKEGKHNYTIECIDAISGWMPFANNPVKFIVDLTKPKMLFVDDTSTLEQHPEQTCSTNKLRVKWKADDASGVGIDFYIYSLFKDGGIVINSRESEWFSDTDNNEEWQWVENLNLQNGIKYFFSVNATDFASQNSNTLSSNGITVDTNLCRVAQCGDGIIDTTEKCDDFGPTFGAINECTDFTNFRGGTLRCDDCEIDTSDCEIQPSCGDGVIQRGEHCDGDNFGAIDECADLGFHSGELSCSDSCILDTSECVPKNKCGNNIIDPGEECDGSNLGPLIGQCKDYDALFTGGTLSCNNCKIDTGSCFGVAGTCGNEVLNIDEKCDGNDFGSIDSCNDYDDFDSGSVNCTSNCNLDTSACIPIAKCGNKIVDPGEECDENLTIKSCKEYSDYFSSGSLSCSACLLNTENCKEAPKCGNKIVDPGETCDGDNFGKLNNLSCSGYSKSFLSGTLACNSCKINTGNCKTNVTSLDCKDNGDCGIGSECSDNSDCSSRFCENGVCSDASCNDGIKNQDESDNDCGGLCGKCDKDDKCRNDDDCKTGFCDFGRCQVSSKCSDKVLSSGEADVDCGGICPQKCSEGGNCESNDDCETGFCDDVCKSSEDKEGVSDKDQDQIPDTWELENGLDSNNPEDASQDFDDDGLTNLEEYNSGADPNKADSDGDGFTDKEEIDKNTNPLDSEDYPKSKFGLILLSILLIILFVVGGYLGYYYLIQKKKPTFKPLPLKPLPTQGALRKTIPIGIQKAPQMVKKKENERLDRLRSIFEKFIGKKEEPVKEKQSVIQPKKSEIEQKRKSGDIFTELKKIIFKWSIEKPVKKEVQKRTKEYKGVIEKLRDISKKAKKRK